MLPETLADIGRGERILTSDHPHPMPVRIDIKNKGIREFV